VKGPSSLATFSNARASADSAAWLIGHEERPLALEIKMTKPFGCVWESPFHWLRWLTKQQLLNHQPTSLFLCPAYFPLVERWGRKTDAELPIGEMPKMARRQTETTYLKEILLWLREYWTE